MLLEVRYGGQIAYYHIKMCMVSLLGWIIQANISQCLVKRSFQLLILQIYQPESSHWSTFILVDGWCKLCSLPCQTIFIDCYFVFLNRHTLSLLECKLIGLSFICKILTLKTIDKTLLEWMHDENCALYIKRTLISWQILGTFKKAENSSLFFSLFCSKCFFKKILHGMNNLNVALSN
jgi:hypothetical protein